jgi:hypothetical protein
MAAPPPHSLTLKKLLDQSVDGGGVIRTREASLALDDLKRGS